MFGKNNCKEGERSNDLLIIFADFDQETNNKHKTRINEEKDFQFI